MTTIEEIREGINKLVREKQIMELSQIRNRLMNEFDKTSGPRPEYAHGVYYAVNEIQKELLALGKEEH